ncbi:MAG: hypothetical protein PUD76_04000 [Clostridia bacterium]|nr:hypothetical protein [Clostridia bacterium]
MILAPFGVKSFLCICIIAVLAVLCKKLLPLRLHDRAADLPQAHLRNIAGGNAQGIDGGRRIEIIHMGKFVRGKILVCLEAQAGQQHIGHADLQRVPVEHLKVQIVQFLQQAVLPAVLQILQVVREVVRHGIVAGGSHRVGQCSFLGKVAKGVFQRFYDCRFKGRVHFPDGQRTEKAGFMGVRHIEVELQDILPVIPKHSDALGSTVYPAAKLPVPAVHFKHRRSIRALGIDQDLLVKGAFVVVTGGTEKACPALIAGGNTFQRMVIQLGDKLKFCGQGNTS